MITVDSSDQKASPDFQHFHGIGYAPSSSRCAQVWFSRPWTPLICSSSCLYCSMSNTISPFGICEIRRPLNRKTANVPSSKIKLFAHCCHDSVESLISTADHIIDIPWIFPLFRGTNAHGSRAHLVKPCWMSDFLSLSHHFFGAFTNPHTAFLNRSTVS